MRHPTTSVISDLSFELNRPKVAAALMAKHPYVIDQQKPLYEQWVDFACQHIQYSAQHNPQLLVHEMFSAIEHWGNAYSRTQALGAYDPKDTTRNAQPSILLDRMLSSLKTVTPSPTFDATVLFWVTRDGGQHSINRKLLNNLWPILEQYGLEVDPKSPDFHYLWEDLIRDGQTHEAQWLINKGLLPTWTGALSRYSPQAGFNTYQADDNILWLVNNKQNFDVLAQLPTSFITPLVNHVNGKGQTPLHHAAKQLLPEYVALLLQLGADPNATTPKGEYPSDMIKRTKKRSDALGEVLALLGQKSSKTGEELFIQACKSKDITLAKMALDKGVDIAVMCQQHEALELVFAYLSTDRMKQTRERQLEFIKFLLSHNVDLVSAKQQNVLHWAIKNGASKCVKAILETAPHYAVMEDHKGRRPAQMFTKQMELDDGTFMYLTEVLKTKELAKTQMAMFKLFLSHDERLIQQGDFPNAAQDAGYQSQMSKLLLTREVGHEGALGRRKKM